MSIEIALNFHQTGKSHALSSVLLYRASIDHAQTEGLDVDRFAFNGTHSLSVHYLLGLGLELMLKAAIVAHGGPADDKSLQKLGHDLVEALDTAEHLGFVSGAPRLRSIVEVLQKPYMAHWFRYSRPDEFELPGDFAQVIEAITVLDEELRAILQSEQRPAE